MVIDKYLIISKNGSVQIRERTPRLAGSEIALRLRMSVPNAFFERPVLVAEMKIPDTAVPKSSVSVEVTDNLERIVREVTGLEMRVSIEEQEQTT